MRQKYVFGIFLSVLIISYVFLLYHLKRDYSEVRYIPKTSLSLPTFTRESVLQHAQENNFSVSLPAIEPTEPKTIGFQVLFDNTPLKNIDLIRPWEQESEAIENYGRFAVLENKPKLAILLINVGLDEMFFSEMLNKMPPVVTLSFSPYAQDVGVQIKNARQKGFEALMNVELQNQYENAGALSMRTDASVPELKRLIDNHYFALNVPFVGFWMQDGLSDNQKKQMVEIATEKGMLSLFSQKNVMVMEQDFYASSTRQMLAASAKKAQENGEFILVLPAHPSTIEALIDWVGVMEHPNISIVPVSALGKL